MYINKGNLFVTESLSDIPKNQFKLGNQFVLLENEPCENRVSGEQTIPINMSIEFNQNDIFYEFRCYKTYIYGSKKNNQETNDENDDFTSTIFETKEKHRAYLRLKEKLIFLLESNQYNYLYDLYEINTDEENIHSLIYNTIKNNNFIYEFPFKLSLNNCICSCMPIKLDEENYLILVLNQTIYDQSYSWYKNNEILLFSKNQELFVKINVENFNSFYEEIKNIYKDDFLYFEDFEKSLFVYNYNIHKHLRLNSIEKDKNLQKIKQEFKEAKLETHIELNKFFGPFYEDKEHQLEVYTDNVEAYNKTFIVFVNGKRLFREENKKESLYAEAKAVFEYEVVRSKRGFNPFDGKFYTENGELDHATMSNNYFACDIGVIYETHANYKKVEKFLLKPFKVFRELSINDYYEDILALRIEEAKHNFIIQERSGVHPLKGKYYLLDKQIEVDIENIYADHDGIMIKDRTKNGKNIMDEFEFYLSLNGYFIKADKNIDKEKQMIYELIERRKTACILTKNN